MNDQTKLKIFKMMKYVPSEKQWEVHKDNSRFKIVAAGARFGKSMLSGAEAIITFLEPNKHIWICGTQYELAEREFNWVIELMSNMTFGGINILKSCEVSNSIKGSRSIYSNWGSFIETKSTEKPQTLLGEELDLLILSEASQISKKIWERMLRARLGSRKGKLLAISTPNSDGGLFFELYNVGLRGDNDWKSFKYKTIDNPYFDKKEYETARKEIDEKVFKEQYEGEFVSRRGFIFTLKPENILQELHEDYKNWACIVGIERGYKNPTHAVIIHINPDTKELYITDEYNAKETSFVDCVKAIAEKVSKYNLVGYVGNFWDYTVTETFNEFGIGVSINEEEKKCGKSMAQVRRIQAIQNNFKIYNNSSKLRIYKDCVQTIDSLEKVKWEENKDEEKERPEQEIPKTKYINVINAIAHPICMLGLNLGQNIYGV
jgi:hypothetical protein